MAKKRNPSTKLTKGGKEALKNVAQIMAAWQAAGCPEGGIVVDGTHYHPLPFGTKADAAKAGK